MQIKICPKWSFREIGPRSAAYQKLSWGERFDFDTKKWRVLPFSRIPTREIFFRFFRFFPIFPVWVKIQNDAMKQNFTGGQIYDHELQRQRCKNLRRD
jgi:hypothetical protein